MKFFLRMLRKFLLPVAACLLLALLLHWGVLAGYTVPTASMEPVLRGDPVRGDRVAVFKLQYKLFSPRRFDLVVFHRAGPLPSVPGIPVPGKDVTFVKRLVALPGEALLIQKGDLYLGATPREPLRKPLNVIQAVRIPVYRWIPGADPRPDWRGDWWTGSRGFRPDREGILADPGPSPGAGPVCLTYSPARKVIFDDYIDRDGHLHEGRHPVGDVILEVECAVLSKEAVLSAVLREGGDRFRFRLPAGGRGEVWSTVAGQEHSMLPLSRFPGFEPGRTFRVTFMNVDDRLLVTVDGRPLLDRPYSGNSEILNAVPENVPTLEVEGGRVRIRSIAIFRDIHYTNDQGRYAVRTPYTVPGGSYFFLGDNSAESMDSRFFGAVPEADLVGRPFLVFYPFSRFRFL